LDVKTAAGGVSFYVQRNTTYSYNETVIPYEVDRLNIGGAMNLTSGVFTSPVNGRYYFSFIARSGITAASNWVYLRINGVRIGIALAPSDKYNLPMVATLNLKKGDTVDVYLATGSTYDDGYYYTQFSGFLVEEDLAL